MQWSLAALFGIVPVDGIWLIQRYMIKNTVKDFLRYALPSGVPVRVKSWSINWPQAITITVPAWSWKPSSGCRVRETTRDSGKSRPVTDILGALIPSAYSGPIRRWNGAMAAPQVGCSKLLQSPSKRRYLPGRHSTPDKKGGHTSLISVFEVSIWGSPFSISS